MRSQNLFCITEDQDPTLRDIQRVDFDRIEYIAFANSFPFESPWSMLPEENNQQSQKSRRMNQSGVALFFNSMEVQIRGEYDLVTRCRILRMLLKAHYAVLMFNVNYMAYIRF